MLLTPTARYAIAAESAAEATNKPGAPDRHLTVPSRHRPRRAARIAGQDHPTPIAAETNGRSKRAFQFANATDLGMVIENRKPASCRATVALSLKHDTDRDVVPPDGGTVTAT